MTKNTYIDGPAGPGQLWCAPARSPQGHFGVLIAVGHVRVSFIDEADLDEYLLRLLATGSEQPTGGPSISMVRAAQLDLPKFKAGYKAATAVNN
jgi:hypothetical protein